MNRTDNLDYNHDLCPCAQCHRMECHRTEVDYYVRRGCALCEDLQDALQFSVEFKFSVEDLEEARYWQKTNGYTYSESGSHNLLIDWMISEKMQNIKKDIDPAWPHLRTIEPPVKFDAEKIKKEIRETIEKFKRLKEEATPWKTS